jgi:hypothetical protein
MMVKRANKINIENRLYALAPVPKKRLRPISSGEPDLFGQINK